MSLEQTDKESAEIAASHGNAPRVTLASIHAKIANVAYHTHECLTVCIVTMKNGFFVVGTSAPASPENFDAAYGQKLAHDDAIRQIWRLEGYLLRELLRPSGG